MKILIVDFDEDSSNALSEYLKSEDFGVIIAGDGELGLEKCKSEYPDLVIVEPMISKLHGFELCSIISHDFNGQIPVVILTKFYREEQFKIEAMSAYGASAFLSKPFKGPEILSTINDLLKEKTKESEETDMAEEIQDLEDFSEQALDNINIEAKIAEQKLKDDFENEILEPVPPAGKVPEKKEKSSDIKTQVDKMLEDTLSEFGINLGGKAPPKREENSAFLTEEKIKAAAKKEAVVAETLVSEQGSRKKDVEGERVGIAEEEVRVYASADIPDQEESKESAILASTAKMVAKEPEEEIAVAAREKENTIFSAIEDEKKPKVSPLAALKHSLQYLKKIPLKFIIPLILVAAIALSASFIFRKPKSKDSTPQNFTAAMHTLKKSENSEPEEALKENPDEDRQSQVIPSPQDLLAQPPAQKSKEEAGEVKTKVNEVFAANDPTSQELDVENVNLEKDVLSEPTKSSPLPLLAQELPVSSLENNQVRADTPSEEPAEEPDSLKDLSFTQEEQPREASQTSDDNPPVEEGDLIPLEDVDIEPETAKRVDPQYPSLAFQRGVEGKVVINVLISESGDVIETSLIKGISGPYGFNENCTNAARQWKFVPAFKNGVKVKVWKTISFTFKKS